MKFTWRGFLGAAVAGALSCLPAVASDQFTYVAAPTVSGVGPSSGPAAGGTSVTITGTGFNSGATVAFGATAATGVTVVSGTEITATSPAESAGTVNVTVVTPAGTSATSSADDFTYSSSTFTPAWQVAKLGGGGNLDMIIAYPDGTMLNGTDVADPYIWTTASGKWLRLLTNQTVPGSFSLPTPNPGTYEAVACAYSNQSAGGGSGSPSLVGSTSDLFTIWNNELYGSTNKGASWSALLSVPNAAANAGPNEHPDIACDPASSGQIVFVGMPGAAAQRTVNGGTSFSTVSTIPAPTTCSSKCGVLFAFDPTSTVTSGATQGLYASSNGNGVWHSTNGGSSWTELNSSGMPTGLTRIYVDQFGQVWGVESYGSVDVWKYASGTWTTYSMGGSTPIVDVAIDPNSASAGAQHITAVFETQGNYEDSRAGFTDMAGCASVSCYADAGNSAQGITSADIPWLSTALTQNGRLAALQINPNAATYDASGNMYIAGGTAIWKVQAPIYVGTTASGSGTTSSTSITVASGLTHAPTAGQLIWDWTGGSYIGTVSSYTSGTGVVALVGTAAHSWNSSDNIQFYGYADQTATVENLVTNRVISIPGAGWAIGVWDKGLFADNNPDVYPSVNVPAPLTINVAGYRAWDVVTAQSAPTTVIAPQAAPSGKPAISTTGGVTWTAMTSDIGDGNSGYGASYGALSATDIVGVYSNGHLYNTTNGGSTWAPTTLPGSPGTGWQASDVPNKVVDTDSSGFYYAYYDGVGMFTTTGASSGTWTKVFSGSISTTGLNAQGQIHAVPGKTGNVWYSPGWVNGPPNTGDGGLYKSTNGNCATSSCQTWSQLANVADVQAFGFGAARPGGDGYPTLYFIGWVDVASTWTYGLWQSTNADQATPTYTNLSPGAYPGYEIQGWFTTMGADTDVYGRVYACSQNKGCYYYDSSDACPWVAFAGPNSTIYPTQSITRPYTLTAQGSGLSGSTVTSVSFIVNGTTIHTFSGGGVDATYSTSWTTSQGPSGAGNYTLEVSVTGNGCTATKSIPVTTTN